MPKAKKLSLDDSTPMTAAEAKKDPTLRDALEGPARAMDVYEGKLEVGGERLPRPLRRSAPRA